MQENHAKLLFIGAGNMARAIIGGLVSEHYPSEKIQCYSPTLKNREKLVTDFNIISCDSIEDAISTAEIIILAVKPQIMAEVCENLSSFDLSHKTIVSLAAGITLAKFKTWLPQAQYLVRAMPNTPTLVGQGVTGLYTTTPLDMKMHHCILNIFNSLGQVIWLSQETELNALIAVTGSAPAYLFLFMEAMQSKAQQLGFTATQAHDLILQTIQGSATLASQSLMDFKTLRQQVTSAGGTTEQAIRVFQQNDFSNIIEKAMQAAIDRALEMEANN